MTEEEYYNLSLPQLYEKLTDISGTIMNYYSIIHLMSDEIELLLKIISIKEKELKTPNELMDK